MAILTRLVCSENRPGNTVESLHSQKATPDDTYLECPHCQAVQHTQSCEAETTSCPGIALTV